MTALVVLKLLILGLFSAVIFLGWPDCKSIYCWILRFVVYALMLIIVNALIPYNGPRILPYNGADSGGIERYQVSSNITTGEKVSVL